MAGELPECPADTVTSFTNQRTERPTEPEHVDEDLAKAIALSLDEVCDLWEEIVELTTV